MSLDNSKVDAEQHRKLRMAARALGRAGLVHAFGHCSVRTSDNEFLVCAAQPMGCIPAGADNTPVPVSGDLPDGVLGEVRIHQAIYQRRPNIAAVCRIMSPAVMALSTQGVTPKCRHGLSAYFANDIPLWRDPRLLRNDEAAQALADLMGERTALVMRGNGAVVAAETLEEAISYAWFLEDTARLELSVRSAGFSPEEGLLDEDEVRDRQVMSGNVFGRMWQFLTDGDPEEKTEEN
ncbi:ribulose-5-phosphate 4-epimerase-like epimerase or aldolase [Spongiibacter sp. IMCC21906]|uniref:class II aldolase/adducin family protein n=1 Tax=Spongiibacter sp. IMCC21906 TaxID=1620392 RepID=UPI00062DDA26|nr:class II aldolase/adducin family protein [Spongiibacter sp. IMCC21906]AKH70358.1 ribulose-5-phosphate 4-epimerase-like epimerase or aldolase [Spongiibacter sp. IMCC21906]